ncbi:MAG: VWA domain-containing protein [Clostridiales bacterium]|nr:VWA domain-containing protein [Candidatus Blautia equi]
MPCGGCFGGPGGGVSGPGGGGSNNKNPYNKIVYDFGILYLILSLITAVVFWFIGEYINVRRFFGENSIIQIGLYFFVLGILLFLVLLIAGLIKKVSFRVSGIIIAFICALCMFFFGMLFEFIYELDPGAKKLSIGGGGDIIFLMDNSESMSWNDPQQQRVSAVEQILSTKKSSFRFAVYTYGQKVECVRPMSPLSNGIGSLKISPSGGTPTLSAFELVIDDLDSGVLPYSSGTQVIFLTDGENGESDPGKTRTNNIINSFKRMGIPISTVTLGTLDASAQAFIDNFASQTGGSSITAQTVDLLGSAMSAVAKVVKDNRTLISPRSEMDMGWLYAMERICFLTLLGVLLTLIKLFLIMDDGRPLMIIISSLATSLIGAILLELIINNYVVTAKPRLYFLLLTTVVITQVKRTLYAGNARGVIKRYDKQGPGNGGNFGGNFGGGF